MARMVLAAVVSAFIGSLMCGMQGEAASAASDSATTGVAYGVYGVAMAGKFPGPENDVSVADGHRLEDGRRFVVVVGDSNTETVSSPDAATPRSTRYLTWLTFEFADQAAYGTYTLPAKDVRVYYSVLGFGATQQEELYSEKVTGSVSIDDDKRIIAFDLVVSLVSQSEASQRRQRSIRGKYVFRVLPLKEMRWPWGSR
ncbi:MAG: hypothetical protein HY737_04145 [Candidatus Omnitrophica bacterium]|nr:hypothetical protein [Candidatus Omnitrophota bacterium]